MAATKRCVGEWSWQKRTGSQQIKIHFLLDPSTGSENVFFFPSMPQYGDFREAPVRSSHPQSQAPNYLGGWQSQPQLRIYSLSLHQKAKVTSDKTSSVLYHIIGHRRFENRAFKSMKITQLKAHLEGSKPLKAVMKSRTVHSLSTWRVLEDSFPLHKRPGQMRKSQKGWPEVAQYPGPLGRKKEEAGHCVHTKLET